MVDVSSEAFRELMDCNQFCAASEGVCLLTNDREAISTFFHSSTVVYFLLCLCLFRHVRKVP